MSVVRVAGWLLAVLVGAVSCACQPTVDAAAAWRARDAVAKERLEPLPEVSVPRMLLVGATIWPAIGEPIPSGWLLAEAGRIVRLGAGSPPADAVSGARVLDATGRYVTPGIIDSHSHIGVYPLPSVSAHKDGNEMTSPETPGVWAEHGFWPQDPSLERAVAGGITSMLVLPGSGNLIGGRGVPIHMRPTRGARGMRFPGAPDALKMACGENPKRVYGANGRAPMSRMGNVSQQRAAFEAAAQAKGNDPHTETLRGAVQGDILVHVHCYRADDMLHMLELAHEFGFQVRSFHHAVEAYKIRDILAERDVSVSTWADWWGFKMEALDSIEENAAFLTESGVRAIIHSDSPRGIQRLNQEAAKAYFAGLRAGVKLTEMDALRWVTANPAWAMGIDGEVGTLEPGKRADLVVWDANPFSVYASAELVFVDGALVWDKHRPGLPWSDFELGGGGRD